MRVLASVKSLGLGGRVASTYTIIKDTKPISGKLGSRYYLTLTWENIFYLR